MNLILSDHKNKQAAIFQAQQLLKQTKVKIGLPSSASDRNRWLLALHERGAPGAHIPPRPVVGPALGQKATQAAIQQGLLQACEAAAQGDATAVMDGFDTAGQAGVESIHTYIDAGIEPSNAPITIHGGWMRNNTSGKPVHVEGKGFDKPLYDTGELYQAFDYEITASH